MKNSSDEEEISDAWANFTSPSEHDCDRQSIPTVRLLSQVDKEDQEASSQQKVSPISTYFLSSLTLNFQRIFCKRKRISDWINEGSELIEAHLEVKVVQSEYFFIDSEEETSDAEVEEEIFVEEADEPQDDDASDDDDDGEENEAEKPTEAESGASSSSKGLRKRK